MKKVYASAIIIFLLFVSFIGTNKYILGRVEGILSQTDTIISDLKKDDYDSACKSLTELKDNLEHTTPTFEKLLVHESVDEIMRSVDDAIVYCNYKNKVEAIKEIVGAQYLLNNLKEVETFSLKNIF